MENIKEVKFAEKKKEYYDYLYNLGNAMLDYYAGTSVLSLEQIELIANSSDDDKINGMYLAACDRQKIRYSYSTFSKNTDAINAAKMIKIRK